MRCIISNLASFLLIHHNNCCIVAIFAPQPALLMGKSADWLHKRQRFKHKLLGLLLYRNSNRCAGFPFGNG